jgi:Tol biopolymer transport system component
MKKIAILLLGFSLSLSAQIPAGKKVISSLYVYDLASGKSELILTEKRHFEAPNWSRDGQYLLINAYGKLEKISPTGVKFGELNTGSVDKANNDHGYSFDGKSLYISSAKAEIKEHTSFIYKVSSEGGNPVQLTPLTPSYWHGISPDGKMMVYCAARNGNYDVYAMSSNGGDEIRLTSTEGLDDGPEYSHLYQFVSVWDDADLANESGRIRAGTDDV